MKDHMVALRRRLSRVSPWVAVASLLALAIMGYYSTLGVRYWETSRQVASLTRQVEGISDRLQEQPPNEETLAAELFSQEQRLMQMGSRSGNLDTGYLMPILTSTARDAGIDLLSIATGEISLTVQDDIRYQARPMTLTLQGPTTRINRFLLLLHQGTSLVTVSSFRMSGIDGVPSAQVQLLFHLYLLPDAVSKGRAP